MDYKGAGVGMREQFGLVAKIQGEMIASTKLAMELGKKRTDSKTWRIVRSSQVIGYED